MKRFGGFVLVHAPMVMSVSQLFNCQLGRFEAAQGWWWSCVIFYVITFSLPLQPYEIQLQNCGMHLATRQVYQFDLVMNSLLRRYTKKVSAFIPDLGDFLGKPTLCKTWQIATPAL